MPSPFPGMNPWLEAPNIWPDFHGKFANTLHSWLNENLTKPYYARLEMRSEVGVVEEEGGYVRRIVPDVSVVRRPTAQSFIALAEPDQSLVSESPEVTIAWEKLEHAFVEVRDPSQGHHLVTLIEIVSPSNKNQGPDRDAYSKKQAEVLASDANLIEIDLLRGGQRLFAAAELFAVIAKLEVKPDYVVLTNRAAKRRNERMDFQIFPISLANPLPRIALPLRDGQPEILVDLQALFETTYRQGPYARGAIDYAKPPVPPLSAEREKWAAECLRKAGMIANSP